MQTSGPNVVKKSYDLARNYALSQGLFLLHLELIWRKLADHAAVFHQLVEFGEVITSNSTAVLDF